jgi:hypothetical protein
VINRKQSSRAIMKNRPNDSHQSTRHCAINVNPESKCIHLGSLPDDFSRVGMVHDMRWHEPLLPSSILHTSAHKPIEPKVRGAWEETADHTHLTIYARQHVFSACHVAIHPD